MPRPSVKAGLARFLKSLEESGDIVLVDAALVSMAKGLAASVDAEPANAALWREMRATLTDLREQAAGGVDDDTQSFLFSVRTPRSGAQVGYPEDS